MLADDDEGRFVEGIIGDSRINKGILCQHSFTSYDRLVFWPILLILWLDLWL